MNRRAITAAVMNAAFAREALLEYEGNVLMSVAYPRFLFRLAPDRQGFECRDIDATDGWRPATAGNLLFVEDEKFAMLPQ